jgi:hypothetical protein
MITCDTDYLPTTNDGARGRPRTVSTRALFRLRIRLPFRADAIFANP